MLTLRIAQNQDVKFLVDCINKDYEINDHYMDVSWWTKAVLEKNDITLDTIKKYLNPKFPDQELIIVNNNNKDVGFFSQDLDMCNMVLGATCFVHPRACKMSILKLVKACTVRGILYGLENSFESVEFNTWAGLITHTVKAIIPSLKEYKIRDNYRICESSFDLIKSSINKSELIDGFSIKMLDSSNMLFFMEDK